MSQATFADLGRLVAVHRKRHGSGGVHAPYWFMLHARGTLYALGRLQFNRDRLSPGIAAAVRASGLPAGLSAGPGEPSLGVHIPGFLGPLVPARCRCAGGWPTWCARCPGPGGCSSPAASRASRAAGTGGRRARTRT
ncbi:DUF5596 domain-containing protein [Nonomuraea sp. FMUSA5-5]|uniref:DUF5596 domain-containing protein n=1 Tax=Nonomuraea composti TaxID=2720023 RepID=A0ABX1AYN5_9ACTN|nr:acyltransferase domain-containing protein [Nonomuraea sp. FMUSA5-5]NJP88011.1 DUF5596 domain-containing protein [Nonomuraea sp. FMUSA5-5]